jgi:hypothetical protein
MKKKLTIVLVSSLFLILASLAMLGITFGWLNFGVTLSSGSVSVGDLSYTPYGSLVTDNSIIVPGQNLVNQPFYFGNSSSVSSQMRVKITYTRMSLGVTPTNNHIISTTKIYQYYPCWSFSGSDYILDDSGNLVAQETPGVIVIAAATLAGLFVGDVAASDIVDGANTYTFFRAWEYDDVDYILDGSGNLVEKDDPLVIVLASANLQFITPESDVVYEGATEDHLTVTFLSEYYFTGVDYVSDIVDFLATITYSYEASWVKDSVHYILDGSGNLVDESNPGVIVIAAEDLEDLYVGYAGESDILDDTDTYTYYPAWVYDLVKYVFDLDGNLVERDTPATIELDSSLLQGEFVLGDGDVTPDEADDDYWYFGSAETSISANSGILRLIRRIYYDGSKASIEYNGQPISISVTIQVKQSDHVTWSDLVTYDFETGYPVS